MAKLNWYRAGKENRIARQGYEMVISESVGSPLSNRSESNSKQSPGKKKSKPKKKIPIKKSTPILRTCPKCKALVKNLTKHNNKVHAKKIVKLQMNDNLGPIKLQLNKNERQMVLSAAGLLGLNENVFLKKLSWKKQMKF
jgi:hypothetical protein